MAGATANSVSGGCEKAPVDYRGSNIFGGKEYHQRVQEKLFSNEYHGFPTAVETFGGDLAEPHIKIGNDGLPATMYEIDGSYRGVDGIFEYMFDNDGMIVHRLFKPKNSIY